jgi:hypothetical protein
VLASSPSSSNPNKSVEEIMMMFDSLRWSGAKHVLWCDQERLCPMCDLVSKMRFLCLMKYVSRSMWIYVKSLFFCLMQYMSSTKNMSKCGQFFFSKTGAKSKGRAKSQGQSCLFITKLSPLTALHRIGAQALSDFK